MAIDPKMISRKPAAPVTTTPGSVDEAEPCLTLADYHGPSGRIVIGIVLRPYLESQVLTATEVIHNNKHLTALLNQTKLVENAIVGVSTVQARQPGHDQRSRRMSIEKAIEETRAKARTAQLSFAGLPKGRPPVEAVLAVPPGKSPTGDVDYDLRVAVGLELAEARTWSAKLDRLVQLTQWDRDDRLTACTDAVIGDLLCTMAATQELLGASLLPGAVLVKLAEMVLGGTSSGSALGPDRAGLLNAMVRQGKLPQARAAVLDRIRRQLRAPQPLARTPKDEAEVLHALMGHLATRAGVVGGGPMAEALTVRYSRRLEQGGASAYRRALLGVCETLGDLVTRVQYLAAVSTTPAAERHRGEIVDAIDGALNNELLVENLVLNASDLGLLRESIAGAAAAIRAAGLPEEARERLAARMEGVADEFARSGRLFHRVRQVEPILRRRVMRLAELAVSGLVREDGALPMLRRSIQEIARQPQFQADLLAQQSSEVARAEVRRLHELLERFSKLPAPDVTGRLPPQTVSIPASAPAAAPPPAARPPAIPQPLVEDGRCPACFESKAPRELCRSCGYPTRCDNRNGVHLLPGTRLLGRFRTGRLLGQGGFGATYLGWDDRLHVRVAVKEFYPVNLVSRVPGSTEVAPFSDGHARGFAAGLTKFLDEARLLARLRDIKEIVGVQDFFEENRTAYLVMELLEGRTLKAFVAENGGRMDCRRTLAIVAPIMKALQAVHDQGLVHRDVSPDNIFLTASGQGKLLDFGAARQAAGAAADLTVILKPGYAPPEQYAPDGRQGPWTDVYAVCATIYCALAGKAPPDATTRFLNDHIPALAEHGASVPPAFEAALRSGLAMRWQDRPQSVRSLLQSLVKATPAP